MKVQKWAAKKKIQEINFNLTIKGINQQLKAQGLTSNGIGRWIEVEI